LAFGESYTRSYQSAIRGPISLALVPFSSYFTLKDVVTLRGHSRSLKMGQFVFHCNCGHIPYRFRDNARYGLNIRGFSYTPSPLGKTVAKIFALDTSLVSAVNKFCKRSSIYSQLKRVTDVQTDRQTDRRKSDINSGAYCIAFAKITVCVFVCVRLSRSEVAVCGAIHHFVAVNFSNMDPQ